MSNSTSFVSQQTVIQAPWLNDINNFAFSGTVPSGSSFTSTSVPHTPSGAGAIATTVGATLANWIYATDYGGNNTASFNKAITAANALGGGLIVRPNGSSTAAPANNVNTVFMGSGSTTATATTVTQNALAFETQIGRTSQVFALFYTTKITSQYMFGALFDGTEQAQATGPAITHSVLAEMSGTSVAQGVAYHGIGYCNGANKKVFGANFIVGASASSTGAQMVGLEIDVEPSVGATLGAGNLGIAMNAFNFPSVANGILFGGVSTGTWANGILFSGIASTGSCLAVAGGAAVMDSFINTANASSFNTAAMVLGNLHRIQYRGTAAVHGYTYMDGSNNLITVPGSGVVVWLRTDGVTTNASLDNSGNINATGAYRVAGTQVVGARITGYGTPTGGVNQGSFAAGSITLANLAASVAQLILDLKTHGLLGT